MTAPRLLALSLAIVTANLAALSCSKSGALVGTSVGASSGTGGAGAMSSTTTAGGAGGTAPDSGGNIICTVPYSQLVATNGPCNLLNQNCPEGETCVPSLAASGWTTACSPSPGLKTANEDCFSGNECGAKLYCVGNVQGQAGKCVAFCCPKSNEPCNGGLCNLQVDLGNGASVFVCTYDKPCELLAPNACPSGYGCHAEPAAGMGLAYCVESSPTPVPELGTCHFLNDCGDMQQCRFGTNPSAGVCLYYCALTGPKANQPPGLGGCPMGETCQSSYDGVIFNIGAPNIGLCVPNGGLVPPDAGSDTSDAGPDDASEAGSDASEGGSDASEGGPETPDGGADAPPDGASSADSGIHDASAKG
jgi:hypothetical protein